MEGEFLDLEHSTVLFTTDTRAAVGGWHDHAVRARLALPQIPTKSYQ
jgi:hypothetical protein